MDDGVNEGIFVFNCGTINQGRNKNLIKSNRLQRKRANYLMEKLLRRG
jgi:hypothetical protein